MAELVSSLAEAVGLWLRLGQTCERVQRLHGHASRGASHVASGVDRSGRHIAGVRPRAWRRQPEPRRKFSCELLTCVHDLFQPLLASTQCLLFAEETARYCLSGKMVAGLRMPRKFYCFRLSPCELRESAVPGIVWIQYRVE